MLILLINCVNAFFFLVRISLGFRVELSICEREKQTEIYVKLRKLAVRVTD